MPRETISPQERIQELAEMLPFWQDGKSKKQIASEFLSFATETKRIPDEYYFIIKEKLYSPITGEIVEKSIEKNSYLGKLESEAFEKIQNFAVNNKEGSTVWISPSKKGFYPCSKIIFSFIEENKNREKVLFNCSLIIDTDPKGCLEIANLISIGKSFNNFEQLRSSPIFLESNLATKWMEFLTVFSNQINGEKNEKISLEYAVVNEIFSNLPPHLDYYSQAEYLVRIGREKKVLGDFKTSCGGSNKSNLLTASNLFTENSLNLNEAFFDCPRCHKPIPSGQGITVCPHCGARKEDYSSCI